MRRLFPACGVLLLGIFILGSGCADVSSVAGPEPSSPVLGHAAEGEAGPVLSVQALKRTRPLTSPVSVTVTVDPATETTAELPGIGRVTFSAGTFAEEKTITITAPRGRAVALDFTHVPEREFARSVQIELNLAGTEAEHDPSLQAQVVAGHFNSMADIQSEQARVDRMVEVTVRDGVARFEARGFSGYICGSGRSSRD